MYPSPKSGQLPKDFPSFLLLILTNLIINIPICCYIGDCLLKHAKKMIDGGQISYFNNSFQKWNNDELLQSRKWFLLPLSYIVFSFLGIGLSCYVGYPDVTIGFMHGLDGLIIGYLAISLFTYSWKYSLSYTLSEKQRKNK